MDVSWVFFADVASLCVGMKCPKSVLLLGIFKYTDRLFVCPETLWLLGYFYFQEDG